MPSQKDLKKIIRARMQKTGEAYTAARLHIVKTKPVITRTKPVQPPPDYAPRAGMSDAAVKKATGRDWNEWVLLLDAAGASEKPHRDIAKYVATLGTPSWWAQMVTVGYERVRGLRDRSQRREGTYEATKSRTFTVPVDALFAAFANARTRRKWLAADVKTRTSNARTIRGTLDDGTAVQFFFTEKANGKSAVAVQHQKLADKAAVDEKKLWWHEQLDALAKLLK
jgi:uncharacterized protein YndB with AHSA1/START domain